ncbi:MAG TPA: phosphonate C-P lyase system protein PhnG [Acetobacteraceae bacterium]|jgi:alpha-D-ribose 1-methylphosphonate 5-triphosphate synthase subunit PhnG|nr:phosphonate C-P lyase system protein PhnG [Acetobacteraceae bacterium]
MDDFTASETPHAARRHWMGVLARADAQALATRLAAIDELPRYSRLRGPESGLVMVRGRAGGNGAPFNLGEMTVTRCTVRTADGLTGHAYVTGREMRRAELAAVFDALLQDPARQAVLQATVIAPLEQAQMDRRAEIAAKAAATKVNFFAMRNMRT